MIQVDDWDVGILICNLSLFILYVEKKVVESLKKKIGCLIFECEFEVVRGIFFWKNSGLDPLWDLSRDPPLNF